MQMEMSVPTYVPTSHCSGSESHNLEVPPKRDGLPYAASTQTEAYSFGRLASIFVSNYLAPRGVFLRPQRHLTGRWPRDLLALGRQ
jgi:hypothetical protein